MEIIRLIISPNLRLRLAVTYFWTLPKIRRPSSTAKTIVEKLSSMRTKSLAFCVTAVPAMPIATPTSALFRAGASLTPSPVMATTCPADMREATIATLSDGHARAKQRARATRARSCSSDKKLGSWPSFGPRWSWMERRRVPVGCSQASASAFAASPVGTTSPCAKISEARREMRRCRKLVLRVAPGSWSSLHRAVRSWGSSPSCSIPICFPIAAAVSRWSPVIITTWIPARRHFAMLGGTEARGGS
mmetsp:Transcript_43095/g.100409  ORF Transcript_43095/g.100409 Transcript_43095/m.100409 type:complete len:247 (-) Transcript_43095:69-809(-)